MSEFAPLTEELINGISEALVTQTPRIVVAILFLLVAVLVAQLVVRRIQRQVAEVAANKAQQRFLELAVRALLWFAIVLTALSILGYQTLATALGTATGFLAIAVAYGLKDVLDETVAGIYLIADDDFVEGNLVTVDGETGTIRHVGIRRTVLADTAENERITIANDRIEPKWTLYTDDRAREESAAAE